MILKLIKGTLLPLKVLLVMKTLKLILSRPF